MNNFPLILATVFSIILTPLAMAGPQTAYDIMKRVQDRDDGDRVTQEIRMILIDKNGRQRKRAFRSYAFDVDVETEHRILFFSEPADIKDTGLLTFDYAASDADDDQWLYLPALNKSKRIASGDQSGSFVGSDLSFSDLTDRNLNNWDYKLLKEDMVRGEKAWVIEALPNTPDEIDETGIKRQILWVQQNNDIVVRRKDWLESPGRTKFLDVREFKQTEGIWYRAEMHITSKRGDQTFHKTIMYIDRYDLGGADIDPNLFSLRRLESGI